MAPAADVLLFYNSLGVIAISNSLCYNSIEVLLSELPQKDF